MENVIAEYMYASCDVFGNKYLMMDLIVYYRKYYRAITVPDQKVVHIGWSFMWRSTVVWQLY